MKVAIIGSNGFIGSRMVEMFHLGGRHTVAPIVRKPSSLALPARFDIDWRIGDALDVRSLTESLAGCDTVVHSALGDPLQIERMPGVLCAAAVAAGIQRVVYISSASVHGQAPASGTDEDAPLTTRHAMEYNNAKIRAERSFFQGCKHHNLVGFALRPGVVFGPRSRWISDLAQDLRQNRAWLLEDGDAICNSIYVDNLVCAVAAALTAPPAAGGVYLVGDAERVTWADFYRAVADGLGINQCSIHRLATLPVFRRPFSERIGNLVASPVVQAALPGIPSSVKQFTKRLMAAATPAPAAPSAWRLPERPQPRITQELALLQQCRWKFPHAKAEDRLGYRPSVSFSEGMRRSMAWLAFAEGRV